MHSWSYKKCLSGLLFLLMLGGMAPFELLAQSGEALVVVGNVDSEAFPLVNVAVRVCDEIGPEPGLEAGNFQIQENGSQVSAANIRAVPVGGPVTELVLAIDTSMNASDLIAVKKAAVSFVQNFVGAEDRLAVVAFYDDVELILDFTDNKQSLVAAIDALSSEGNMTAFNDAAIESVRMLGATADVRGVILVTNSPDNISQNSVDDVVDAALEVGATLYPVGFGRVKPEVLKQLATNTGGQSFIADPGVVESALHTAGQLLEQGVYRLSFLSAGMADGEQHKLTVTVSSEDIDGNGSAAFVATQRPVSVNMPSVTNGQTVYGEIDVPVQAAAPAAIASVTYLLDDSLLAEVTAPPFILLWDTTTLTPDTYQLSVEVVDKVGNRGAASVSVKVIEPLQVTATLPEANLLLGQTVAISTQVSGSGTISQVTLLVNGQPTDAKQSPPYDFLFDSSSYVSGTYTISVVAQNDLGQTGIDNQTLFMQTPPPQPQFSFLRTILAWSGVAEGQMLFVISTIGGALLLVLSSLAGLWAIVRFRTRRRQTTFELEIANLGNVSSQYQLRAAEPMGALRFGFSLNGVSLPKQVEQTLVRRAAAVSAPQSTAVTVPARKADSDGPSSTPSRQTGAGAQETAGKALAAGSAAAGALGVLGRLLPGAAGRTAQQAARPIHQTQSTVGTVSTKAKSRMGQVGGIAPKGVTIPKPSGSSVDSAIPTTQPAQDGRAEQRISVDTVYVEETLAPAMNGKTFFMTPTLDPGDIIWLEMTVSPVNPYRSQQYRFKVVSEAADALEPSAVVEEGEIAIRGLGWLLRSLPYVISAVLIGGVVIAAAVFIAFSV